MAWKGGKGLVAGKTTAASKDKDKKRPVTRSSRAGLQVRLSGDCLQSWEKRAQEFANANARVSLDCLANPAPIIQTFYAEDRIFDEVKLDGVVTLVDAKHASRHLDEVKPEGVANEVVEQVAYARSYKARSVK